MGVPPLFYVPPPISLQSPSPSLTPHVVREELPSTQIVASHTAIHRAVIWGGGFKHRGGLHPHPCGFCTPPPPHPVRISWADSFRLEMPSLASSNTCTGSGRRERQSQQRTVESMEPEGVWGGQIEPGGGSGGGIRMGGQQRFLLTGHNDGGLLVELHAVDFLQAVYRVGTVGWMLWGGSRPTAPPPPTPPPPLHAHPRVPTVLADHLPAGHIPEHHSLIRATGTDLAVIKRSGESTETPIRFWGGSVKGGGVPPHTPSPPPLPGGVQHLVAVALVAAQHCALVWVPQF